MLHTQPSQPPVDLQLKLLEDSVLPEAVSHLRAAVRLLKEHPRDLMSLIAQMPSEKQQEAFFALYLLKLAGPGIEGVLTALDLDRSEAFARLPLPEEPQRIMPDKTMVFLKESKIQYDMRLNGLSSIEEIRQWHIEQGTKDIDNLLARHESHVQSVEELQRILGHDKFYPLYFFDSDQAVEQVIQECNPDCIIVLGGDDTIKAASHLIGDRFVWLLNSDEIGSIGAHCTHTKSEFSEQFKNMREGNFLVEEWPLLEAQIVCPKTGETVTTIPALDEIEIGDELRKWPFRGVVNQDDREPTPVKGDGLLYATPAGYGGWYASETEAHYPLGHEAPNTNEEFEVVAYGRYRFQENTLADLVQDPKQVALRPGKFKPGDPPVTVRTTSCHTVRVNVDCVRDYPVPRDAEVTVGLSDQKLRVISRQLPSLSSLTKVSYRPHQQQGKEE